MAAGVDKGNKRGKIVIGRYYQSTNGVNFVVVNLMFAKQGKNCFASKPVQNFQNSSTYDE